MDTQIVELPTKHLTCNCVTCQIPCSPYKVEYLYGNLILMNAICPKCLQGFWIRWDLLKVQLEQDEKDAEEFLAALKKVEGAA